MPREFPILWVAAAGLVSLYTPIQIGVAMVARKLARRRKRLLEAREYLTLAIAVLWVLGALVAGLLVLDGGTGRLSMLVGIPAAPVPVLLSALVGGVLFAVATWGLDPLLQRFLGQGQALRSLPGRLLR